MSYCVIMRTQIMNIQIYQLNNLIEHHVDNISKISIENHHKNKVFPLLSIIVFIQPVQWRSAT